MNILDGAMENIAGGKAALWFIGGSYLIFLSSLCISSVLKSESDESKKILSDISSKSEH